MKRRQLSGLTSVLSVWMVGLMLGVTGCGKKTVPETMTFSAEPNETLAVQNAGVSFMTWVMMDPSVKLVNPLKAYEVATDAFQQALDKKELDGAVFAKVFCNRHFVDSHNSMRKCLRLMAQIPKEYQPLDKGLMGVGFNLFFLWCTQGQMVRGTGQPVVIMGTPKSFVVPEKADRDIALQNVAFHLLRKASLLGFQPVRGKMTFETILMAVKDAVAKEDFKSFVNPDVMVKAFCDKGYLDCLDAQNAFEVLKSTPSDLDPQTMNACLGAVSKLSVNLMGTMRKKGCVESVKK